MLGWLTQVAMVYHLSKTWQPCSFTGLDSQAMNALISHRFKVLSVDDCLPGVAHAQPTVIHIGEIPVNKKKLLNLTLFEILTCFS